MLARGVRRARLTHVVNIAISKSPSHLGVVEFLKFVQDRVHHAALTLLPNKVSSSRLWQRARSSLLLSTRWQPRMGISLVRLHNGSLKNPTASFSASGLRRHSVNSRTRSLIQTCGLHETRAALTEVIRIDFSGDYDPATIIARIGWRKIPYSCSDHRSCVKLSALTCFCGCER
jgi:hypothetical protein